MVSEIITMDENENTQTPPTPAPTPASAPDPAPQLPPPAPTPVPAYASVTPTTTYVSPAAQTNVWAIISLVSSILAWCGFFGIGGIVGMIAGIVARNQIAASRGTQSGDGIALVGIILGAVNVFGTCLALLCFGLAFGWLAVFSL
jgi:hypothetical protein